MKFRKESEKKQETLLKCLMTLKTSKKKADAALSVWT